MKKPIIAMLFVALLSIWGNAFAEECPFAEENFSATLYLTTDYVCRGISYSNEDPAIQGTFDYAHPCGIYAGIWASSWDSFELSNNIETGYYAGYAGAAGNIGYNLSGNYYVYPDADDHAAEWDYLELVASINYSFDQVPLSPMIGATYVYSPDYFGEDGNYHYGGTSLNVALPMDFGLGFTLGYADVEGDKTTTADLGLNGTPGYHYTHWQCSLSRTVFGFGLDLSYHDTDEEDYFGNIGGSRVVFTLSRSM